MPSDLVYAQDAEESMLLEDIQVEQEEEDLIESDGAVGQNDMSSEEYETEQQEVITEIESETQDEEEDETEFSIDPQDAVTEENAVSIYSDEDGAAAYDLPEGEPTESGDCGENAAYKLYDDGSLYIEGTGVLYGRKFEDSTVIKTVYIGEGITGIGECTFQNDSNLVKIIMPDSLTEIQDKAFADCSSLKEVTLPDSLINIGKDVFEDCSDLRTAHLSAKMVTIPEGMFSFCRRLNDITLPDSVIEIGDDAFRYCSELKELSLPAGLKKIGAYAFSNAGITESYLPSSLTEIGEGAFSWCGFTSIELPESLQKLGVGAFSWCQNLEEIKIPNGITEIKDETFDVCSALKKVVLSSNITRIGKKAFSNSGLNTIDLPDSVTEIDDYAFSGCNITEFRLPQNLKTIGYGAFCKCNNLTNIQIPEKVESIDTYAFAGCSKLIGIYIPAGNVSIESKALGYNSDDSKKSDLVIIGNAGSTAETYASANGFTFHNVSDSLTYYQNVASTCVQEGNVEYWHCDTCNVNFSNAEGTRVLGKTSIDKIKHDLVWIDYKSATCTETGNNSCWHCKSCGKNFDDPQGTYENENVVIQAYGHNMRYHKAVDATCSDEGLKAYYQCWNCDKYFLDEKGAQEVSEQELIIPKNNVHNLYFEEGYDATCNSKGIKGCYYCDRCNKRFLDAKGEREVDEKDLIIPPNNKHSLSRRYEGEAATCYSEGRKAYYECNRCDKMFLDPDGTTEVSEKDLVIPRIDHSWGPWEIETYLTSSGPISSGSKSRPIHREAHSKKVRYCTMCGESEYGEEIAYNLNVNVDRVTLKYGQSTTAVKVSGMTSGDYVKSVTSSNKSLVTVSNVNKNGTFKLTAKKKAGKAYVTIKLASNLEATIAVTVQKGTVKTTKLSGVPTTKKIKAGKKFTIKAVVTPKNSQEKITYTSSNKKIVTVTSKGVVKGVKKGTATITVKSGSKKKTCKVTVK